MNRIGTIVGVAAAASMLLGCASRPDQTAGPSASLESGYRKTLREGKELYCRTDRVTGSRTQRFESCLTRAELDAAAARSRDMLRRVDHVAEDERARTSGGGFQNDVTNY